MLLGLESFDAYTTPFVPASQKWDGATAVTIGVDEGRSGLTGDNAAFFDTALGSILSKALTPTDVSGVYTFVLGHAVRALSVTNTVVLASLLTAASQFDLVLTAFGRLQVLQSVGGIPQGIICESPDNIVPIGAGGCYIGWKVSLVAGDDTAVQVQVSDQYGDMIPLMQGALLSLLPADLPYTTMQLGGGIGDEPAQWYVDDVYIADGVPAATVQIYKGQRLFNNDFLGNVHVQAFYATADGANLSVGNTPWVPSFGSDAFAMINEHPPDEDATYIEADTVGQLTTCLFASPYGNQFGLQNCTALQAIYGLQWDGRLRTTGVAAIVYPVVRRVVTGLIAGDVIALGIVALIDDTSYLYYPRLFDRNIADSNVPWSFRAFLPAGVGVAGTIEFGVRDN